MRNFNFLDYIQFKGGKANVFIKWIITLSMVAITGAFIIGQYRVRHINKLNDIESLANKGIEKTEQLEKRMEDGFKRQNIKIDRIYNDGVKAFNEYREFNNKQLKLIIDYGHDNKDLLKIMLELNSKEKAAEIKNDLKYQNTNILFDTSQSFDFSKSKDSINISDSLVSIFTNIRNGNKVYHIMNAPENYLDTLDLDKYIIVDERKSRIYNGLYNFIYKENNNK